MKRIVALCAVLLLAFGSSAMASDIVGVSHYGGGTQIWMQGGSFDSQSGDFVEDTGVGDIRLGDGAYSFPVEDGTGTVQEWWAEYSIAQADVPGVTLSGTWNFFGRVYQYPGDNTNYYAESDYLWVKGDPDDGSGASWYADALASVDNDDDRVFNDIFDYVQPPIDDFAWISTSAYIEGQQQKLVVSKEFNLDASSEIVFRLNEREAGPYNAIVDLMCWSTAADWEPTDDDYLAMQGGVPGDADGDGVVDLTDLGILATNWGRTDVTVGAAEGDFDDSGAVDLSDLGILATNWGTGTEAVPEPATMSLLGLGGLALIRRRR